jgi:hypothetical protein
MYGIGLAILADAVNGLPAAERSTGAAVIQDYGDNILLRGFGVLVSIGSVAFAAVPLRPSPSRSCSACRGS